MQKLTITIHTSKLRARNALAALRPYLASTDTCEYNIENVEPKKQTKAKEESKNTSCHE